MKMVALALLVLSTLVIGFICGFIYGCKLTLMKVARGEVKKVVRGEKE